MKINNISPDKHKYLQMVSSIAKPPGKLYYIGTLPTTRVTSVAIVGTRKPTRYGVEVTTRFASELASRGIVVISGLALGVDALAHKAALDVGGTTIAVLANCLPRIQPSTNQALGDRIVREGGAILCEHAEDGAYVVGRWSFLERNRLVAGLADAILITEASAQSGTLNTAMHALEQGKEVFVIPGNITSPQSAGCNALIKQGAHPVTCVEDILQVIAPVTAATGPIQLALGNNPSETAVIETLQAGLRDGDEIQRSTGIDAIELSTTLTMLELAGTIRSLGANQWTLR